MSVDLTNVRLETERTILRFWRQEDLEAFHAYCSVPGVGELAGWPHHESMEESREALDLFLSEPNVFALEWKQTGRVIGSVSVDDFERAGETGRGLIIGYDLSKDFWGQGIMPEAVRAVTRWCFDTLCCDYITCGIFVRNFQSRRVAEKCGFQFLREESFPIRKGEMEREELYILRNPNK